MSSNTTDGEGAVAQQLDGDSIVCKLTHLTPVEKELFLLRRRWGDAFREESHGIFSLALSPTDPDLPAEIGSALRLR